MDMKKLKKTVYLLMLLAFAFGIMGNLLGGTMQIAFLTIGALFAVALLAVLLVKWRCPHCRRFLWQFDSAAVHYKYCGKELNENEAN